LSSNVETAVLSTIRRAPIEKFRVSDDDEARRPQVKERERGGVEGWLSIE